MKIKWFNWFFKKSRDEQFDRMLGLAKYYGACSGAIRDLEKYNTIEEALKDEEASYWCYWYAENVIHGPYRDWETDRKSTLLNSSHSRASRMPSSA